MGSRILSRSFVVEKWEGDEDEDEDETSAEAADTSLGSAMDVDEQDHDHETADHAEASEDSSDEDGEDSSDVAMVPMADILNARYQTENVSYVLFYRPTVDHLNCPSGETVLREA